MYTVDDIGMVSVPTSVQLVPSIDSYAENVLPLRVSLTHRGAVAVLPAVLTLMPLVASRRWNAIPFAADTKIDAWADSAASVSRIMSPAFTQAATFWTEATRATIDPSPVS